MHHGFAIRTIEEPSTNAWPALRSLVGDGWVLRFSHGYETEAETSVHDAILGPVGGVAGVAIETAWGAPCR
jgi:hypothetical protein